MALNEAKSVAMAWRREATLRQAKAWNCEDTQRKGCEQCGAALQKQSGVRMRLAHGLYSYWRFYDNFEGSADILGGDSWHCIR